MSNVENAGVNAGDDSLQRSYQETIAYLETVLKNKSRQLDEATQELETIVSAMSHDLRAPLRAISGYALILREEYGLKLDGEGNRLINVIQSGSKKMDGMINDLISFSHVGKKEAFFRLVEMKPLIESCINELLGTELKSNYSITVANLPGCIGDEQMLKSVWLSLLDNAIKYSSKKSNPVIEVGFEEDEAMNIYFVKDRGAGFDMKYSDKLFQPFQRLHRDDEYEGSGAGLAFVKRIILKHSGSVWVQSVPNEGSTFYFSIPKKIPAA